MGEDNCVEAAKLLYHYLDGELTPEGRTAIKRHLDDCPPCLGAYDFEVELRVLVARRCREQAPDALRERIYKSLQSFSD